MAAKHYVLAFLSLFVLVGAGLWLFPAWQDYCATRTAIRDVQRDLLAAQAGNEAVRAEIHQLRHDARAVERIARDKFGYCQPNEKVYDFRTAPAETTPAQP